MPPTGPRAARIDDQLDFELDFFGRILRRNPHHVDALRQHLQVLARAGRHHDALVLDQRLVKIRPGDCIARYNMACHLSIVGQIDEAMTALNDALRLGYRDIAHLEADSDLDSVRHHPRYVKLIAEFDMRF